ncbi:hypothetical protein P3521_03635 [Vibrio parahaemolyticus]|uniref:hypothetical protein n=1 Tax=Vibrio parahaemolyticus TaxID=670 RepID=UPI00226B1E13|nr:hypothetical protein [Vibrio parahaemolyticus]MCX8816992.1 hypothetical protein [Vibrio parahaemolyticus]MDF4579353.1 hypothetical protein [Vibrio parahaemolyticus]MDF4668693.1 hypothetical protein [Vibrio parahaemolyticus]HAV1412758.1 hypothetical protein [Vibrio parahaemolyticus]HAV2004841.1 hypothetical protein [Vibrio parahaemolyticus]
MTLKYFPRFFHQTCTESDKVYIQNRLVRLQSADVDLESVVRDYERRYLTYSRSHANAWLDELSRKQGQEQADGMDRIQGRLERLVELRRSHRVGSHG